MKKQNPRISFRKIREASRLQAAESAWQRADQASGLRRLLSSQRRFTSADRCGAMKADALKLVSALVPDQVRVTIDDDFQIGLVSVCWVGHGRFHLPARATLTPTASRPCSE